MICQVVCVTAASPRYFFGKTRLWHRLLSSDRLRKVKNKGKFQIFSSKSGRSRLREVVAFKRYPWLGNFWCFGKLVAEERWSLTRGGRNRRFDCIAQSDRVTSAIRKLQENVSANVSFQEAIAWHEAENAFLHRGFSFLSLLQSFYGLLDLISMLRSFPKHWRHQRDFFHLSWLCYWFSSLPSYTLVFWVLFLKGDLSTTRRF